MKVMVKDLAVGQQVDSDFSIRDIKTGVSKRNTNYIRCSLADKTGQVTAVWWDWDGVSAPSGIIRIKGQVSEYQGAPQIVISEVLPRTSETDDEFEKVSQYSPDEMWSKIVSAIVGMDSSYFRDVASDIMFGQGLEEAFKKAPAASSMHHAFQAGLLEHTSQMVEVCQKLFELPFIRNALNKDLCMFGIVFHDFGKIFEYEHTGGFKHTIQGKLVPHIPMTASLIYETANKLEVPEIIRDHMMHVVLAHHGRIEHGSPVDMAIPEAAFVHYVDNLHGDVYGWIQKIEEAKTETVKHGSRQIITKRFNAVLKEVEDNLLAP